MEYVKLGKSDLRVSRICMGCMGFGNAATGQHNWTVDEEATRSIIKRGLDLGINFYDTAIAYQAGTSEAFLGIAIREYAKRDERVRIIHNVVNQRLPESLNIGFRTALGKYLTWTSDDNRYLPTALARMVEELDNNNDCPMVCADMHYIDAKGNITGKAPGYDEYYMLSEDLIGACFLYRREVLDIIGEYDPSRVYVEDYDYELKNPNASNLYVRLRDSSGNIINSNVPLN